MAEERKRRILKNGESVEELDNPVILQIKTKCPNKWTLLDNETGEVYRGKSNFEDNGLHWEKLNRNNINL